MDKKTLIALGTGFVAGLIVTATITEARIDAMLSREEARIQEAVEEIKRANFSQTKIEYFAQEEIRRQLKTKFTGAEWHDSIVTKSLVVLNDKEQTVFSVQSNRNGTQMAMHDRSGKKRFYVDTLGGGDEVLVKLVSPDLSNGVTIGAMAIGGGLSISPPGTDEAEIFITATPHGNVVNY